MDVRDASVKAVAEDVLDGAAATALTPDELMKLFQ